MQSLLNNALTNNTLDNGYISSLNNNIIIAYANLKYILSISIYIRLGRIDRVLFSKRAIVYKGFINLEIIL